MRDHENSSPSYSPYDLALIERVLLQICNSRGWAPKSENAMEAGRFLLAKFEDGTTDSIELLDLFEQFTTARERRIRQD